MGRSHVHGWARLTARVAAGTRQVCADDERERDGGGAARDQGEADGAPGEGDQRPAAGLVRCAGVAVVGAAARDRGPVGREALPPSHQRLHVRRDVGLAGGALLPRRRALLPHLRVPAPPHLRRGGARTDRAQAARIRCWGGIGLYSLNSFAPYSMERAVYSMAGFLKARMLS